MPNSTQNCLGSAYKYLKGVGIIQELYSGQISHSIPGTFRLWGYLNLEQDDEEASNGTPTASLLNLKHS